jgi:hypothetical protein
VKDWWMKNGEIFDTDACGELVVNNSVEDGSDDARDRYFKSFHRVVGLDQILTVATSPSHLSTSQWALTPVGVEKVRDRNCFWLS